MREFLRTVLENVRRRWREWRDPRVLAGEAVVEEVQRWTEVDPSSLDDDLRSRLVG